ncbi:MAG: conjugal transfer protein TraR [Melioribacteraceae bacterium]|nr:conjugal transfer protein TraR [Melioribacteraceae bacterium]
MAKKTESKTTTKKPAKSSTKSTASKTVKKAAVKKAAPAKKETKPAAKKSTDKKAAPKKTAAKTAPKKKTVKAVHAEVEVMSPTKKLKKVKGYSKKELEDFKKVILDKREEIIEQLQVLKDQMMDPTTGQYVNENSPYSLHMAEQGTDAQEREKLYLWAQRETKFLGYLEDALQRIDNGTYGICIDCIDEPQNLCATCPLIPKERLMAVPHTQHCLQVKQKMQNKF